MSADRNNVDRIRSPAPTLTLGGRTPFASAVRPCGHTGVVFMEQAITHTAATRAAVLVHEAQSRSLLGSIGHGILVIILVIFFIGLAIGLVIGFVIGRLSRRR